jgi:hypothetical protein
MRIAAALLALLAAAPLAAPLSAQTPDGASAPVPAERFRAMDSNGDGTLDRAEWKAAGRRDRGFDYLDTDKDGKLTQAEIAKGLAAMKERQGKAAR